MVDLRTYQGRYPAPCTFPSLVFQNACRPGRHFRSPAKSARKALFAVIAAHGITTLAESPNTDLHQHRLIVRTLFLLLLLAVCPFWMLLPAQIPGNEARFWYFGTGTDGLEFNGAPISATVTPAKLTNKASGVGFEGMIVVNDPTTGTLLFYSDGSSVIASNHTTMNNGGGLMGVEEAAVAVTILERAAAKS